MKPDTVSADAAAREAHGQPAAGRRPDVPASHDELGPGSFGKVFVDRMLAAEFRAGAWSEARVVPYARAPMSPSTISLHYGQSVFEGMKAFRGVDGRTLLFRPGDHFRRMNRSARRMCMPELPREVFLGGIEALVGAVRDAIPDTPGHSLYLRPIYFAADECVGVRESERYSFFVLGCPVGAYHRGTISLHLSRDNVRSHEGGTGDIKTAGNYAACLQAGRRAREAGYDEVLWVDARTREHVEECGTMNVFFVLDGVVVTPPASGTILAGITRASVLELLRAEGASVAERPITIAELQRAHADGLLQECFGTGTAAAVKPVERIGVEGGGVLELPPAARGGVASRLGGRLEAIRTGRSPGPPGWIVDV